VVSSAPKTITPSELSANRIAGTNAIAPDDPTVAAMRRANKEFVVSKWKLCVGADGKVIDVESILGSGWDSYDNQIRTTIQQTWRYRPFIVDGKAASVCSGVVFKFQL
jgi:hypothetical protein